jgi:hypothetical protein
MPFGFLACFVFGVCASKISLVFVGKAKRLAGLGELLVFYTGRAR